MAKITTTELVNKIFAFCEAYSGIELFPYQAQFGKRIIRSILENDGEEITALFSRQCLVGDTLVHMADGTKKPIKEVKVGEKVLAFDYNTLVEREVIDRYRVGKREVYKLRLKSGYEIECTLNHRFLDRGTKMFKELARFEAGDEIGYLDENGKTKFSRIKSITFMGDKETYDLEVEGAENFLANNILVHNSGKSETVATISGGLAIILPTLANMPMFVTDKRLDMFKNGIMIGIFAPTLRQAQITFSRMKKRMNSAHAQAILSDPEINISFDVSNGQNIILSNGSLICSQTASEGSNIEGDSYMLIIVDESQDVGNFKYTKSISPMGAFYNATKVLIGTATTQKGFFYEAIERNKKEYANGGKRNHFEYNYKTVIKYNPKYEKYIEGEKKRIGEHSITGDRNVTVRINGLITTMPIEELYNLFSKDSNQGEGKIVPTNLEALSASKGKVIDSLFDLKEYHLTPKQLPIIKALQEIGHTNYNYKQLIAEKTGLSLNRVSHVLAHVRKLMKQGYYYEIVPEWNKVTSIIKHKNKHNIYRMSNGQGETVVTECHSLMEVLKDGLREVKPLQASDLYRIREIPIDSYLDFVDFNFLLDLNDEVYNEHSFTQFVKEDGFIKLISRRDKTPSIRIREKLEVGSEEYKAFCRILGAYVSEGHVLQRDLTAGISSNNIEWIRQLQRDVQLVFNYNAPIVTSNKLNAKGENYDETYRLCLNRKLIGIILKILCGQGSRNKKIPNFLFNVSRDNVKDFLKYLVEGDGYKIKGESNFGYTTASLQLASGLQLLLTQLGRSVHVQRNKNGYYILKTQEEGILNRRAKLELKLLDKSKYEYVYDLEVENAHTFVDSLGQVLLHNSDEFQMSYNLKWILERGMFVSGKLLDELADPHRGLSIMDTKKPHVVGIDLGKKQDSTVITVLEVDWDNPTIVDKAQEAGVPDYIAYPVFIKAWKEIQGDNWNEQYDIIMDFLSNFNVVRIVMDATGVGDAIYDRLRANLNYEVIPYVLSRQSKSDLYKHLNSEFRAKRVRYPADEETRETLEFRKFQQQFLDLEKGYSGQLMVVSHPNIAGAHDDFCDSLALAVWGAKGDEVYRPVTEKENIYKKASSNFVQAINRFTAKRR